MFLSYQFPSSSQAMSHQRIRIRRLCFLLAGLFSATVFLNSQSPKPSLWIEKIIPGESPEGGTVTVYYSFNKSDPRLQITRPFKPELTFDGILARCWDYDQPGVLKAMVPQGLKRNAPISVVLTMGKASSPPYRDVVVRDPSEITPQKEKFAIEIVPIRASPGQTVRIMIKNRIMTKSRVSLAGLIAVTFNGMPAEVWFEQENLMARVPMDLLTDARAQVILTVYRTPSEPFEDFFVLPQLLRVLSVTPNPARPGDALHIYIQPPFRLDPGKEWIVQFDSLRSRGVTHNPEKFEILTTIPKALRASAPVIVLKLDRQESERYTGLTVERPASVWPFVFAIGAVLMVLGIAYFLLRRRMLAAKRLERLSELKESPQDSDQFILPLPEVPEELVAACLNQECILYAGSGLSAGAGFPTWLPFVQGLLNLANEKQMLAAPLFDSLQKALQQGQIAEVADNVVNAFHRTEDSPGQEDLLYEYLRKVFLDPKPKLPSTHSLLKQIGFSGVLTTNFDALLERAFNVEAARVFTPNDAESLLGALSKRIFFILKLYGMPQRPDTLLIAPAQYQDTMAHNMMFTRFMETLFFSRTLLFIGASLEGIDDYLKGITFREYSGRPHFALVNVTGAAWQAKAASLDRRYHIRILPFRASAGYPEVLTFLSQLRERVFKGQGGLRAEVAEGEKPAYRSSPLAKLTLENIGPFKNLDMELDPHLNILLGDNGVGKSTILKAIAVGICGKDAQPYAGRLIRSGQTEGKIILETERNQYVTQILQKDGEAELVVRPGRPLEAEGWLAIGFPPLRGVSWELPKKPQPQGKNQPVPRDLLPLAKGELDSRMDKLKQWLVDLDYLILAEEKEPKKPQRYHKLRDEFFKIVDRITPGVRMQFHQVDPLTKQVTVTTDDGVVPIEAVSQGTTSLISWIGVLLQRLFEVYGDEPEPLKRYALMMIDEIDAHMHPKWQQMIVNALDEIFPNVQFIATTHSPLIAVGLDRHEVFLLRREDQDEGDSHKVVVERPKFDPKGFYSDQALTSSLFNLESTLDPKIIEAIKKYTQLAAKDRLNEEEKQEYVRLARLLNVRVPSPQERETARTAFQLLEGAIDERLKAVPLDQQKKLLEEAKVQLQEIVSGSRRP